MKDKNYHIKNSIIKRIPKLIIVLGIFEIIYIILELDNIMYISHAHFVPDYKMISLDSYASKDDYTKSDYKTLFYQTGLSPCAIDALKDKPYYISELKKYQRDFFADINVETDRNPFITRSGYTCDKSGHIISAFKTAPLEDGYILYTPSSNTLGWNNGHIALVTDASNNSIFEAFAPGTKSGLSPDNHWNTYPAFIMFKVSSNILSTNNALIPNVINTVNSTLNNLPYSLFAGVLSPKKAEKVESSQCAHILWYAFQANGLDLDYNGGAIVTPSNIANCSMLEVVQIYGVNPDSFWHRVYHPTSAFQ